MIYIDLDADLNMEDDDRRNLARIPESGTQLIVGSVLVAGRPRGDGWRRSPARTASPKLS